MEKRTLGNNDTKVDVRVNQSDIYELLVDMNENPSVETIIPVLKNLCSPPILETLLEQNKLSMMQDDDYLEHISNGSRTKRFDKVRQLSDSRYTISLIQKGNNSTVFYLKRQPRPTDEPETIAKVNMNRNIRDNIDLSYNIRDLDNHRFRFVEGLNILIGVIYGIELE